ncbi:MAG: glycosyltransferase family 2 protein [Candidatus Roizmanbacteria bacterium]
MTLSIALATYAGDSLDNILACLASVYSWSDEIIIIYGSPEDDKTKAIHNMDADKKVKITYTDNPVMFHINKQKALEKCTKDWILQLDSDEVVSPELRKEIISIISNQTEEKDISNFKFQISNSDIVAYSIPRLNFFLGSPLTKGGQYPDYTIRLYKNGVARFPCKSLHEQVDIKGNVGTVKNNLLHYPYIDFAQYLRKWIVYGKEEAERDYASGIRPGIVNFILYFKIKPIFWFLKTYLRHRGYVDGFAGFVFALFSAMRYWPIYIFLKEKRETR